MMADEPRVSYLTARTMLLVGLIGVGMAMGLPGRTCAQATQDGQEGPEWSLLLDGDPARWPGEPPSAPLDSVRGVGHRLLDRLQRDGHYFARLDSATVDTSGERSQVRVYVQPGPQVELAWLRIEGADAVSPAELRRRMQTRVGAPLEPRRLAADVDAMLDRYEEIGRPLAQIRVAETRLDSTSPPELGVTIHVEEGPELWLKQIDVPDGARTSPDLVARMAGLSMGAPLTNYDPEEVRTALSDRPFFESVGEPELRVMDDGGTILRVPVEERPPGTFDFVLGYLPPNASRQDGQIVGTGHLLLEHLFGGGRRVDLTLDRRPGQTSIFDVSVSDPYLFGLPLRATGTFQGEQRDSTYGERTYGLDIGYEVRRGLEVTGSVRREVVAPGQAGTRLRDGEQRIPRSRTLFYGLGLQYEALDRRDNPRRGVRLDVSVRQGQKRRRVRRVRADGDTTRLRESLRQEQLEGSVRAYVPLFDRQVLVVGGEGTVLRSRAYDRSDLFRLGGAQSLRGYDEDRFVGNVTARGLFEYRLQLERRSYTYAFADLGYVERPALGTAPARTGWHPGYGVGLQIQTALGLIRTTYALSPEASTPADGRIHFGLSVGL